MEDDAASKCVVTGKLLDSKVHYYYSTCNDDAFHRNIPRKLKFSNPINF